MDGAFTVVAPEALRTCDPGPFREAMSRLGAAVHVITTAGPGCKTGATATAVCSVSDAPPTLLMCLNRRSQTNPIVVENGVFCVNTLGAGGAEIADIFAGRTGVKGTDRFATGDWMVLSTGCPVLSSAVIAFDCRIIEVRAVASTACSTAPSRRCGSALLVRRWSITTAPTSESSNRNHDAVGLRSPGREVHTASRRSQLRRETFRRVRR
jgi:flavin reductase (DIM6/NTAB) family NADH-FMN oxidoreductase RutF